VLPGREASRPRSARRLWARRRQAPGDGRPTFGKMHPVRQRRAIRTLLCQVCAGPASRTSRGWLFVMPGSPGSDVEGSLCTKPPICEPCAQLALRHCPHLTDPVAVRVRKPRIWGVLGDQYAPAGPQGGSPTSPPTATSPTATQQPHAGSSPANSYSNSPAAHAWSSPEDRCPHQPRVEDDSHQAGTAVPQFPCSDRADDVGGPVGAGAGSSTRERRPLSGIPR
jgi:hypothetical protein